MISIRFSMHAESFAVVADLVQAPRRFDGAELCPLLRFATDLAPSLFWLAFVTRNVARGTSSHALGFPTRLLASHIQFMPLVLDRPSADLEDALTPAVLGAAARSSLMDLQPIIDAEVRRHDVANGTCPAERASSVLRACIELGTAALTRQINGYSSLRWLYLLRRVPDFVFEGEYTTTRGYDTALAEVISGSAQGASRVQVAGVQRSYPLDPTVVKRLARFCAGVKLLSCLHRDFRWAGKRTNFEFRIGKLPRRRPEAALARSVELYDEKVERFGSLGRMGTVCFGEATPNIDLRAMLRTLGGDPLAMLIRVRRVLKSFVAEVPAPNTDLVGEEFATVQTRARYLLTPVPLQNLDSLLQRASETDQVILDATAAALLFLLFASTLYLVEHRAGFLGVTMTGYLQSDEAFLLSQMAKAFTIMPAPIRTILERAKVESSEQIVGLLENMHGCAWPLEPGPVLRRDGNALSLDLAAAGQRLTDAIVYPKGQGDLGNARGDHFELRVQEAIDESRCRVPEPFRKLRGKTLLRNGNAITDLDAIAKVDERTLLFISCKSVIYEPDYDAGEFLAVRGAASTVRSAEDVWRRKLAELRGNPKGQNYDFSGWTLAGLVCTPTVVWTELGRCTEPIFPGLNAVASLPELQEWLAAPAPTIDV
ncbi:MAG TPA: hypothetical protein VGM90_14050 [Kofleriaceae bacterium]|jgi:hypothetical protein